MSSIYSEIRKEVKAANKKLITGTYTPEYIFKVLQEDHLGFKQKYIHLKNLMVHHYIQNLKSKK